MCVVILLVLMQAMNKTFFNFLQKPYSYLNKDAQNFVYENVSQAMLRNEKSKNFVLRKQLLLNNECKKVLHSISTSYQYIAMCTPIFFSKGNSKFIIATINTNNAQLNDIVLDANDYLIGRVVDVLDNGLLKIQQIEDNKAYIPSVILEHSLIGYIVGYGGVDCNIVFETDESFDVSKINDGDMVVTSGFDNFIPYGMNVGRIKKYKGKLCINRDIDRYAHIFKLARVKRHS